nr:MULTISPECIES: acetyl-CoA carboxylase biotin carboxyl carrier protein [unclassified Leptolyngbya]
MNWNELRELLSTLSQTDIAELNLKSGDFELTVRKGGVFSDRSLPVEPDRGSVVPASLPAPVPVPLPAATSAPAPAPHANDRLIDIVAPVVGTFYRAPGPDEASFVEVGDRIRLGQTVCIIEAMKIMNEIEAEVVGEVVEILVQNAQPVEFGQVLMRVNPGS